MPQVSLSSRHDQALHFPPLLSKRFANRINPCPARSQSRSWAGDVQSSSWDKAPGSVYGLDLLFTYKILNTATTTSGKASSYLMSCSDVDISVKRAWSYFGYRSEFWSKHWEFLWWLLVRKRNRSFTGITACTLKLLMTRRRTREAWLWELMLNSYWEKNEANSWPVGLVFSSFPTHPTPPHQLTSNH